ncbi:MAG: MliC family protein [Asticcacaulis sp.]
MFKTFVPVLAIIALMSACSSGQKADAQSSAAASDQASAAIEPLAEAASATPGFDCKTATLKAEIMVCGNARLAQLDVELTRLYDLISQAPDVDKGGLQRLQGGWLNKRNACATVADAETCLLNAYGERISDLRAGYPVARNDTSISIGPVSWHCPAGDISSTFINGANAMVYVKWADKSAVLPQVISASGARYAADLPEGAFEFWNKGNEVMWTVPGSGKVTCKEIKL